MDRGHGEETVFARGGGRRELGRVTEDTQKRYLPLRPPALPLAESLQNQPIREPSGTGVEVRASLRMEGVWERGIGISSQEVREEALMFSHSAFTLQ